MDMILYFVCKVIRCFFFNICCSFLLCNTGHMLSIPHSLDMTSYHFSRHLGGANLTISFTYIFSRGFKVALYTKGFTIYEPTSQYGDLNIICENAYIGQLSCISS